MKFIASFECRVGKVRCIVGVYGWIEKLTVDVHYTPVHGV